MSVADLPNILTATDNKGGVFEITLDDNDSVKIGIMWVKMQELINHINDLEEKLLSAEEQMEAEDIKAANEALEGDKFIPLEDVERELYGVDPDQKANFADLPETFGDLWKSDDPGEVGESSRK